MCENVEPKTGVNGGLRRSTSRTCQGVSLEHFLKLTIPRHSGNSIQHALVLVLETAENLGWLPSCLYLFYRKLCVHSIFDTALNMNTLPGECSCAPVVL